MNAEIILGEMTIAGKACYVIEDHITPTSTPDTIHIADLEGSSIACPSLEIAQKRKQTTLPIYGVWQILLASAKLKDLDWNNDYFVSVVCEEVQIKQLFVYRTDQNQITTGELELQDTDQAKPILFDIEDLRLPSQPIKALSEIAKEQREKKKARVSFVILCGLSVSMVYGASHWWAAGELSFAVKTHDRLLQEEMQLTQHASDLIQHGIKHKAFDKLYPIAYMRQRNIAMQVESIVFANPPYQITIHERRIPDAFRFTRITHIEHHQNGHTTIVYQ